MNRIVRDHYPAADLPENLREGFEPGQIVRVVIEPVADAKPGEPERAFSLDALFAMRRPPYRTPDEIVADIRRQRDEDD